MVLFFVEKMEGRLHVQLSFLSQRSHILASHFCRYSDFCLMHELVQLNHYFGLDAYLHSGLHFRREEERSEYLYGKCSYQWLHINVSGEPLKITIPGQFLGILI